MLGTSPRNPRRFLGAISPRYMGTTLRQIPEDKQATGDFGLINMCCVRLKVVKSASGTEDEEIHVRTDSIFAQFSCSCLTFILSVRFGFLPLPMSTPG